MTLGRFPSDIYNAKLRFALVYFVPVAVMTSFPVQAFLGTLSHAHLWTALAIGAAFPALSLVLWSRSVRFYSSSSS